MIVTVKMTKHFGNNVAGEVCGFSPDTAAHILESKGGEMIAKWDENTHRFDMKTMKAVPLATKRPE